MAVHEEYIWLQELEQGDERAYKKLFDDFYSALSAFAYKYVALSDAAEDIVQDTLYDLWLRKLCFENKKALKSWLYTAVRTRCLDFLKHQKVQRKYVAEQIHKESSEFFLNRILEEEVYLLLEQALNCLRGQMRKVYELSFRGASNAEIADQLGITLDAVKSLKKRGKVILYEKLKGYIYFLLFVYEKIHRLKAQK